MKKFLFLPVLFLLSTSAYAKDWQIDTTHSTLIFSGNQGGEKFSGGFNKFSAQISLDPTHPENGKISVTIDTASAFAGSKDRDDLLPQKEWLDTGAFPQAQFTSTKIRKISDGHYEVDATLSIKGITKNIILPFTLIAEGDHWRAQGHVELMRNEFDVGLGMFKGENYVKNIVDVRIDLVAQ